MINATSQMLYTYNSRTTSYWTDVVVGVTILSYTASTGFCRSGFDNDGSKTLYNFDNFPTRRASMTKLIRTATETPEFQVERQIIG